MLTRTVGPGVVVDIDEATDLWSVRAHPVEIWQLLLNLATNANDAMPDGGRLVLRTRNRAAVPACATNTGAIAAGDYVIIEFVDSGCGMDEATQARMFVPFFTTKGFTTKGQAGTGLGLATVARIVDDCGGGIRVTSKPNAGTTIEVLLPRAAAVVATPPS